MLAQHREAAARRPGPPRTPTVRTIVSAVVYLILTAAAAAAQTTALTLGFETGAPVLESLDYSTGELTSIGPLGFPDLHSVALAFLPSGDLVAVAGSSRELLHVDPTTGQATVIGPLGIDPVVFPDLAADACGRLWMLAFPPQSGGAGEPLLFQIDPTTGAAEPRGALSLPTAGIAANGERLYSFLENSSTHGVARILRVDPETLELVEVAEVPDDLIESFLTFALDFDRQVDLIDLGLLRPGHTAPPSPSVRRMSLSGELELEASPAVFRTALAIAPPAGACFGGAALPIPAVSRGGLFVLALLVALGGAVLVSRRG